MLTFCSLFSGSSGNAAYVAHDGDAVLIDCGMSGRQVLDALQNAGLDARRIRALLITHEHSDHIKGAGVVARKLGVPIYATDGTWDAMEGALGALPPRQCVRLRAGESFFVGGMEAASFSIPHDASDPVGYRLFTPAGSVAVATDMGFFADGVKSALAGADVVLLESNHDPDRLRENPHYPPRLKSRILGQKGHLSNQSGAEAAVYLAQQGTRHLLLGHLSRENNTPELAYGVARDALRAAGADVGRDVSLNVASRVCASQLYVLA